MNKTLIVIPALNEAATIGRVVSEARAFGDVHVVDDGSSDQTAQKAQEAGASLSRHPVNRGYDCSLETGISYALAQGYYAAITVDADGQLPVERIPEFISLLENGSDIVVGDRGGGLPRWSEILFSFIGKRVMELSDPFCGMKAYKLDFLRKIGLKNSHLSIGTETTMRVLAHGGRLNNLPIEVTLRDGVSRMGSRIKSEMVLGKAVFVGLSYYFMNRN